MGVVIRQGVKASLITYVGAFLGYLVWLHFYPKWLEPEEVGLIRAIYDAVVLLTPFFQGGVSSMVVKFAPYLATRIDLEKKFLGYALLVPIALGLLGTVVFVLFKEQLFSAYNEKSPLFAQFIWYVLPLTFLAVYIQLIEALIRIKLRIVVPRIVREILARVLNLAAVWLYFMGFINLEEVVISLLVVNVLHLIIISAYYVNLRGAFVVPNAKVVRTRFFRPLLDYTGFMLLGSGGGSLVAKIDSMMTAYLLGLVETGVYGIAFLIATVIELPRRIFNSLITPLVAQAYKKKDFGLLQNYYHRSALNLSIISSTLFIGIWSNLNLVYHFVPNKEVFETGKWVVFFIGLSKVVDMSMGINGELIQNSRYYRWNIYLTPLLAILAVITNFIFIPMFGITGAALATLISVLLYNLARFLMVLRTMKITPFKRANLLIFSMAIVTFVVTELIEVDNIFLDLVFNSLILIVLFLLPIWFFRLSPDFNSFVSNLASRVGIRLKR